MPLTYTSPSTESASPTQNVSANVVGKRKRVNKPSIACTECQQRKSRCDLVNAEGCHRCHVLSLSCSRMASGPTAEEPSIAQSDRTGQLQANQSTSSDFRASRTQEQIIQDLDQRTETMLGLLTRLSSTAASNQPVGRLMKRQKRRESDVWALGGAEQVALALELDTETVLRDPVDVGVVDDITMQHAVGEFRDRPGTLSNLLPLEPTDPFLLSAILLHLQPHSRIFRGVIESQLAKWNHFRPLVVDEAVLGLLIVSSTPTLSFGGVVDPYGAAERALSLANTRGLGCLLDGPNIGCNDLAEPWMESTRRLLGLHRAVLNRVAWTDVFRSPTLKNHHPASLEPFFPFAISDMGLQSILHESRLLRILRPLAEALSSVKFTRLHHADLQHHLEKQLQVYQTGMEEWFRAVGRSKFPLLVLQACLIQPFIHLRVSTEGSSSLPTPLAPAPRLQFLFSTCSIDLVSSPPFLQMLLVLPYTAVLQSARVSQSVPLPEDAIHVHGHERMSPEQREAVLQSYRELIATAHPDIPQLLHAVDGMDPPECWKEYRRNRDAADVQDCLDYYDWGALLEMPFAAG